MTAHPSPAHLGQAALARELTERGLLSPQWREVWEQTPRHRFIPDPAWKQLRRGCELLTGQERMDLIYSDEPVVTQLDNGEPGGPGIATSSNSMPSMVARQLSALDVRPGHRVLEIGTATGYVAALLCRRVGEEHVFTVEIDGVLAAQARANLDNEGLRPTLRVTDGEMGLADHAPYDRILSTCALREVPLSLAGQLAPGGILVAPTTDVFYGGATVRLARQDNGDLSGQFFHGASYMPMRSHRLEKLGPPDTTTARRRETGLDPERLYPLGFALYGSARLPGVRMTHGFHHDVRTVWLQAEDGSAAVAGGGTVTVYGPRDLWAEAEEVEVEYAARGRPDTPSFGLTVTPHGQHLWLHAPTEVIPAKSPREAASL
ncbi:methyltransferase domain-containing protein [Streptomyces gilvosporeus]|uniref:methyltransferase domain-containing protein n=1 Tax=Streptomyces gilvosporeus TaxID=553510 RepID=UPI001F2F6207|nr:methyltransferase domain-containing protein [Streptomyces gilvosporeus]